MKKTFYSISLLMSAMLMAPSFNVSAAELNPAETAIVAGAAELQDAGISFDVTEVSYTLGSEEAFVAPVLNNPNNLQVKYMVDNWDVARVNEYGEVTIKGAGKAVITATTYETDMFLAGKATYTINVIDPKIVLNAPFSQDNCGFHVEGPEITTGDIWTYNYGTMNASGFAKVSEMTSFYLVSPQVVLDAKGNKISFEHKINHPNKVKEENQLVIREVGGEWETIEGIAYPESEWGYSYTKTGAIEIPIKYNGKAVEVAFKYTTDGSSAASVWDVKNLIIERAVVKEEAAIAFDKTSVTHAFGTGDTFTAPVLSNPNALAVTYTSSDEAVATVDAATGEVTINALGTTTITAVSEETDDFKAGKASYTLNVVDANIVFTAPFAGTDCGFVVLLDGDETTSYNIWSATSNGMQADGYKKFDTYKETSFYLVSPEITLQNGTNIVSYDQKTNFFKDNMSKLAQFVIREVGETVGEWTVIDMNYPMEDVSSMTTTGEVEIPSAFNGKTVQVAFKYTCNGGGTSGIWTVANLVIKKGAASKQNPEISFAQDKVEYIMDGETAFVAPEFINPNNVEVAYTTDNEAVATVDPMTGEVTIIGEGLATITATSVETEQFESATASYVITVTISTAIEGITADVLSNGKVYDLQGRRVNKLGKGIYVINGKKVVIK